jgi:hypothetical protein
MTHTNETENNTKKKIQRINKIKAIYNKLTANNILSGEKQTISKQGYPLSPLLLNTVMVFLARTIRQEEEIK